MNLLNIRLVLPLVSLTLISQVAISSPFHPCDLVEKATTNNQYALAFMPMNTGKSKPPVIAMNTGKSKPP
ncbi:MAG: hypothetical protein ACKVI8_21045, partial [Paraglaciecola sp.]